MAVEREYFRDLASFERTLPEGQSLGAELESFVALCTAGMLASGAAERPALAQAGRRWLGAQARKVADRDEFVSAVLALADVVPGMGATKRQLGRCLGEIWDEEHVGRAAGGEDPAAAGATAMDVRMRDRAHLRILGLEMLKPGRVAELLGAKATNREKVRLLRVASRLLGLPRGRRHWVYPRFQIDERRACVYEEAERVNRLLGAAHDPWGVASWWVARNVLLDGRPCDLVGTKRRDDLWRAACALVERDPSEALEDTLAETASAARA
jgi:hypothetical protein